MSASKAELRELDYALSRPHAQHAVGPNVRSRVADIENIFELSRLNSTQE